MSDSSHAALNAATQALGWADPARADAFNAWFLQTQAQHGLQASTLRAASADASSRRYFRVDAKDGRSLIVMDAPPGALHPQPLPPFIDMAQRLADAELIAPQVLAADIAQGFALLTDLGDDLYLDALKAASPTDRDALMRQAVQTLVQFQSRVPFEGLPAFDESFLRRELALFPEWCVIQAHGITWGDTEHRFWKLVCDNLVASALAQPQIVMHRDFMPRNLMRTPQGVGILDFQDAVRGPISYDIASLLRDAFISWDEELELDWAVRYWSAARKAGLPVDDDFGEFWRQVEWSGLQRHLKILGLFTRLKLRDGKPAYAQDLPRFFAYATKVALRYMPLKPLIPLLEPLSGLQTQTAYF